MKSETFTFKDQTGTEIFVYRWIPAGEMKGVVQLAHGMTEHAGRYHFFAGELAKNGFLVVANDHRGHGNSAGSADNLGNLGDDGFNRMIENMRQLQEITVEKYPNLPYFVTGHSMGSFLVQRYIALYGNGLNGAVLSGSNGKQGLLLNVGIILAWLIKIVMGRNHRSRLITRLTFGAYNKAFKPNRTPFDWLSRDSEQVDKYIADPLCGVVFTAGFYLDFFRFLRTVQKQDNLDRIPRELPLYIYSGNKDPVGNSGKGIMKLVDTYRRIGITDVAYRLYPDGRHEMHNEINRDQVMADLFDWLKCRI